MSEQGKELTIISEEFETYLENASDNSAGEDTHIRYPLYYGCFKSALTSMFENIDRLNEKRDQYLKAENLSGNQYIDFSDMANNIIAFCGGRGSGKTTALKEFQRILKNFGRQSEKNWWIRELKELVNLEQYERKEIWFTVLDSVDASLLIEKEDIIELILAQMYAMVESTMHRLHYDSDKKLIAEFAESFENVYRNYHMLRKGESDELGDSAVVTLKNMSSGPKIREGFSRLLDLFFQLMHSGQNAKQYLVVTIDDLDLNIRHGYEMLEQIHKYLSDYRIIVLTAVHFEQLAQVCEVYFYKQFDVKNIIQDVDVETLAMNYLLKAIPLSNRIYMMDSRNFIGKVKIVQNGTKKVYVKDYIMKKLSRKLGIYYDIKDLGRHYSIPRTVRELVSYNDFLDSLYTLDPDRADTEKTIMPLYDHNHARMNRDITARMVNQNLTRNEKKDFDSMVEVNILNRSKFTVNLCNNRLNDPKLKVNNGIYQYGTLLEVLNRLEENEDKKFKNCILAFFTSEMTREYYSYRYHEARKRERSAYRLKRFLGASFGNEWLGRIFPPVCRRKKNGGIEISDIGYIKRAQLDVCKIPVPLYEKGDYEVPLMEAVIQSIKRNRIMEMLGCVILLCSNGDESGASNFVPNIRLEIKSIQKEKHTNYDCSISIDSAAVDFDLLGFIGKEWNDATAEQLTENIISGILQGINSFQAAEEKKDYVVAWREDDWKKIIRNQLRDLCKSNFLAFPFYEVDLSYNVLKRARIAGINEGNRLKMEDICTTIQKGYGYIAVELLKEDQQYGDDSAGFYRKFISSPFIRKFGIAYTEEACSKYGIQSQSGNMPKPFAGVLDSMIKAMMPPEEDGEDTLL